MTLPRHPCECSSPQRTLEDSLQQWISCQCSIESVPPSGTVSFSKSCSHLSIQTGRLVPEPEFILHRDAKSTGSPDSGHTLPPVYWTTDPCVSPLWEKKKQKKKNIYILLVFTALLFCFPKGLTWSPEWGQETETMALHHPWHSPGETGQNTLLPEFLNPLHSYKNQSMHINALGLLQSLQWFGYTKPLSSLP